MPAALAERLGCNRWEASKILDQTFEVIKESLSEGDEVRLQGIGVLYPVRKSPRSGVSNLRGESKVLEVPEAIRLKLRPSRKFEWELKDKFLRGEMVL